MNDDESKPRIALAQNLAKKLLKDAGIHNPPTVLNDVIKHLRKNRRIQIVGFELGKRISGIQAIKDDGVVIAYNKKQHPNRQRFTVAHELGHLMLGHTHAGSDYDPESKESKEIEANHFASELLMPAALLKEDYLSRETEPKILAVNYRVSVEAMWYRLLECKLINY